jgi:folate-binding protein YgfZ
MDQPPNSLPLERLGVLRLSGADAVNFLQGQLSNDLARLGPERSLFAGYHNPQGRAIALLRLLELAPGELLAVLPLELVAAVKTRLAKFVLRAKVRLADESASWRVRGVLYPGLAAAQPATAGAVRREGESLLLCLSSAPARYLLLQPAAPSPAVPAAGLDEAGWRLAAIAAGEPQVYAATSEEFVAQMLNLDLLDGIAFEKGCYTGQEVIARAHYRGRVKRRLQRFLSAAPHELAPGHAGTLADGRAFKVVEAARHADGRCEFLAVTGFGDERGSAAAAEGALLAQQLPLPYVLPE